MEGEVIKEDASEEKSEGNSKSKEIRKGDWNAMLKKLTRNRRLSLNGNEAKLDVQRLYPSRTFMIKKPVAN
jgi:hypothetical protein